MLIQHSYEVFGSVAYCSSGGRRRWWAECGWGLLEPVLFEVAVTLDAFSGSVFSDRNCLTLICGQHVRPGYNECRHRLLGIPVPSSDPGRPRGSESGRQLHRCSPSELCTVTAGTCDQATRRRLRVLHLLDLIDLIHHPTRDLVPLHRCVKYR